MKHTPHRLATASTHAKACHLISQNVRYGNKQGHRTANAWSFDSRKTRAVKTVVTLNVDGDTVEYTHHSNGYVSFDPSQIRDTSHAQRVYKAIMHSIDPTFSKKGQKKRIGKKHRARLERRRKREAVATRERMGLKPGQSALHPELND